jgi:hypothetical protein
MNRSCHRPSSVVWIRSFSAGWLRRVGSSSAGGGRRRGLGRRADTGSHVVGRDWWSGFTSDGGDQHAGHAGQGLRPT